MSRWHLHRPPAALRRRHVRLENIALVPASLLRRKATYQALANTLPQGELLIVLPTDNTQKHRTLQTVATLWRAKGRRVTVLDANQLDAGAGGGMTTPATALPPFTRYLRLESIDPATNRARFYLLQWQPTLDGRQALLRIWGRLGTLGQVRTLLWDDDAEMPTHIERVLHQRLLHGYQLVAWQ